MTAVMLDVFFPYQMIGKKYVESSQGFYKHWGGFRGDT